jgi:hypothetical protein
MNLPWVCLRKKTVALGCSLLNVVYGSLYLCLFYFNSYLRNLMEQIKDSVPFIANSS